ncbi:hypothetical protein [Streptomyces niveus]|uniref:hypothetical protein n=1 Tax=Streptomyces niveus TaxID=193462 RepID=UPI0033D9A25F
MCVHGDHECPSEDDKGAYCPGHGITLLYHGDPITPDDLTHDYPHHPEWHALEPADGPEEPIRRQFSDGTCTWCRTNGAEVLVALPPAG